MIDLTKEGRLGIILGVVIILGLVVYFVFVPSTSKNNTPNTPKPTISKVPFNQLPQYFPADVFMEPDAKVIENYSTTFPDGRIWATRVYETSVSIYGLRSDYENYLKSWKDWATSNPYSRDGNVFLSVSKGQDSFVIHLLGLNGKSRVQLSYQTKK